MSKKDLPLIVKLLVVFCVPWIGGSLLDALEEHFFPASSIPDSYTIGYQQGDRTTRYTDSDCTDEYLYFAYGGQWSSLVDVYDHSGNFLYTLFFTDRDNGRLQIGCLDGFLCVMVKSGTVFVFDGEKEVNRFTHDQAATQGLTAAWFSKMVAIPFPRTQ